MSSAYYFFLRNTNKIFDILDKILFRFSNLLHVFYSNIMFVKHTNQYDS